LYASILVTVSSNTVHGNQFAEYFSDSRLRVDGREIQLVEVFISPTVRQSGNVNDDTIKRVLESAEGEKEC
jgi:hypothetical protein